MSNDVLPAFLTQLVGQAPLLLVYFVGVILAMVFWRRCPVPCLLTILAIGLAVSVMVGQSILTTYLIRARDEQAWDHQRLGAMLGAVSFAASVLRAVAVALLLAAVFVGRRPARSFEPDDRREELDLSPSPSEENRFKRPGD